MKRIPWLTYLPVILTSACLAPVALTQAYPAAPVQMAQVSSEYDKYMRLGYAATVRRDYRTALINFRQATGLRPGDRYANSAIENVSSYVNGGAGTKISVRPVGIGAPSNAVGGAVRGKDSCPSGEKRLTALVREKELGLTTAEYPALVFYFPETSADVELALLDENDQPIGKTTIDAPTRTAGIVSLSLSTIKDLPPLEIGKNYHWFMSIICDPKDRSADIRVDGWVRRIGIDPVLASELKTLEPRDRVSLYAVNGLWHDAIEALYEARQSSPQDSSLADDWVHILESESAEIGKIAKEPLAGAASLKTEP